MMRALACTLTVIACITIAGCATPASVLQLSEQTQRDVEVLSTANQEIIDQFATYVRLEGKRSASNRGRLIEANRIRLLAMVDALESQAKLDFEDGVTTVRQEFAQAIGDKFDTRINAAIDMQKALSRKFKSEFESSPGDFKARENSLRAQVNLYYIAALAGNKKVEVLYPFLESEIAKARDQVRSELDATGRQLREAVAKFPQPTESSTDGQAQVDAHDNLVNNLSGYKKSAGRNYTNHSKNLATVHAYLAQPRASSLLIAGAVESISATINDVVSADSLFGQFLNQQTQAFGEQAKQRVAAFEDRTAEQLKGLLDRVGQEAANQGEEAKSAITPNSVEGDAQ